MKNEGVVIRRNVCQVCYCDCGMLTYLKDGKVSKVEGDPENPHNRGVLCAQGRSARQMLADHANVQPHSGAQANSAAYLALIQPGDTVLALKLDHGGHLTHGAAFNFSGKLYNFIHYGVHPETEQLDYDDMAKMV